MEPQNNSFYSLYEKNKPLSEELANSILNKKVLEFGYNLLKKLEICSISRNISEEILIMPIDFFGSVKNIYFKKYKNKTFSELKKEEPELFYEHIFYLWYIRIKPELSCIKF